jgi:hypothetical protein
MGKGKATTKKLRPADRKTLKSRSIQKLQKNTSQGIIEKEIDFMDLF